MKNLIRGGQLFLHNFRMFGQVAGKLFATLLLTFIVLFCLFFYNKTNPLQRDYLIDYLTAKPLLGIEHTLSHMGFTDFASFERDMHIGEYDSSINGQRLYAADIVRIVESEHFLSNLKHVATLGTIYCLLGGLFLTLLIGYLLIRYGIKSAESEQLRGAELVKPKELSLLLYKEKQASDFKFADVPLALGSETVHGAMFGTTGAGKTVSTSELLQQVRNKKQKAFVYDRKGVFISRFYRPGKDIILNPFDLRSPAWNILSECYESTDFDTIAASLIPMHNKQGFDPFWMLAARTLFSVAANRMKGENFSTIGLLRFLYTADLDKMKDLLKNTEVETMVADKAAKMALSVKAILTTYIKCLKYVNDGKLGEKRFSIREWIANEGDDSWVFVSSRQRYHETIKPLIATWIDVAANAALDLPLNPDRRIWFMLDELPTLHQLPSVPDTMALGREYGICFWFTIQSLSQMYKNFGQDATNEILDLCNTLLIFRMKGRMNSEEVAKTLGENEVKEFNESKSYGADHVRDGVSVSESDKVKQIVLPSEIRKLPNLEAYLSLAGDWPITKLKFKYVKYSQVAPAYMHKPVNVDVLVKEEEAIQKTHEKVEENPTLAKPTRETYRTHVVPSPTENKMDVDNQVI